MKDADIYSQARQSLKKLLQDIPVVRSVQVHEDSRLRDDADSDLVIRVETQTGTTSTQHMLVVEAKANGQPRWARAGADELGRRIALLDSRPGAAYGIFAAPYISDRAAEILIDRGVGYFDLAGNGRLIFDGVYFERTGRPNPFSERQELRTVFSPKASRVLRVLLQHPHRPWRMATLAEEAGVSVGLVAKVKPLLLDRDWASDTVSGLRLVRPDKVLDAWASSYRRNRSITREYYSLSPPGETERRIAAAAEAAGARYALTEFSGTERLAPHVRYNRASAYVEAQVLEEVAENSGLRPVTTGPNVRLIEPHDDGIFYGAQRVGGAVVAHPTQLYLDLARIKGRGEEAAEFMRKQVLQPAWERAEEAARRDGAA